MVDDEVRALLRDDDPAVRSRAVLALGQIGEPSSLPDLEIAAQDASAEPRASAAFALGLVADASRAPILVTLAEDASPTVRAAAAEALGRLHVPSTAPVVIKLLDDADMPVRAAAALAAWKFDDPGPFLDPLVANLTSKPPAVRTAAAYALARLASLEIAPSSSGAAPGKLSEDGVARARAALAQRVTDPEAEVRMQIARGLVLRKAVPSSPPSAA
jgi:HEAT repeat protein